MAKVRLHPLKIIENLNIEPFRGHIIELRSRLLKVIIAFLSFFIVTYAFSQYILDVVIIPLQNVINNSSGQETTPLVYTALTEGFFAHLRVSFWASILLTTPYLIYQAWAFVAPGLYRHERQFLRRIIILGLLLFVSGGLFGFFIVFPALLTFSLGYAAYGLMPMPRIGPYVSIAIKFVFFSGLIFEVPFTIALAIEGGIISANALREKRKYFLIGIYALSAFLIPTDIFSQLLLFLPLWGLFEICIRLTKFIT